MLQEARRSVIHRTKTPLWREAVLSCGRGAVLLEMPSRVRHKDRHLDLEPIVPKLSSKVLVQAPSSYLGMLPQTTSSGERRHGTAVLHFPPP